MMHCRSFSGSRVLCTHGSLDGVKNTSPRATPFREWARQRGVEYPKLEVLKFDGGLRGTGALESLRSGECIVRLPRTSAMVLEPTTKAPKGCPPEVWDVQPWYCKLALVLLLERRKGRESHFSGYIESLPREIDLPCFWSEEEIQQIGSSSVITLIQQQKDEWTKLADDLSRAAPALKLDREILLSCLSVVRSRSFSGPYIGSKLGDRLRLGAIVLVMAVGNILLTGTGAVEQTLNAVLAVSTFNFLYEFLLSQRLKVYLLAPGVDFMNHSCHVESDLSYDYFQDGYSVRLDRNYNAGDQVFISYGQRSNDELLQYYGFVLNDNPHDYVRVENGMLKLWSIFSNSEHGRKKVEVPSAPVDVYRQGFGAPVLDTVKSWIRDAEAPETAIDGVLKEFCRQEVAHLRAQPTPAEGKRMHLIESFKKEKISILTKCIEGIEQLEI